MEDCKVSEWGPWSPCDLEEEDGVTSEAKAATNPCSQHSVRHRVVLRLPANGGRKCPGLTDRRRCDPLGECKGKHGGWCPMVFILLPSSNIDSLIAEETATTSVASSRGRKHHNNHRLLQRVEEEEEDGGYDRSLAF